MILKTHQVEIPSYDNLHDEMKTSRPKLERWLANPANQGKEPEGVLADLEEALRFTLSDAIQIYEKGGGTLTGEDLDVVLKWGLDGSGM